jgi:hypothetical protein
MNKLNSSRSKKSKSPSYKCIQSVFYVRGSCGLLRMEFEIRLQRPARACGINVNE